MQTVKPEVKLLFKDAVQLSQISAVLGATCDGFEKFAPSFCLAFCVSLVRYLFVPPRTDC